jgi:hypothetical protein
MMWVSGRFLISLKPFISFLSPEISKARKILAEERHRLSGARAGGGIEF